MLAALPPLLVDGGAVVIYLASLAGVAVFAGGAAKRAVHAAVKPDLDAIHKRIDDHMGEEEAALERVAIAVELIAEKVGQKIPPVIIRGGSD